jgi:hypothetical protein
MRRRRASEWRVARDDTGRNRIGADPTQSKGRQARPRRPGRSLQTRALPPKPPPPLCRPESPSFAGLRRWGQQPQRAPNAPNAPNTETLGILLSAVLVRLSADAGLDAVAWRPATHWRGIDGSYGAGLTPHHDGRMHRSQKSKMPFTVEELMEKGLTKVG